MHKIKDCFYFTCEFKKGITFVPSYWPLQIKANNQDILKSITARRIKFCQLVEDD